MKILSMNILKISLLLLISLFILSVTSNVEAADTMKVKNFIEEESIQLVIGNSETIELIFDKADYFEAIVVNDEGEEVKMELRQDNFINATTWTSSNESVVKVDERGNVTALIEGTATIKVEMTAEIDDFKYLFYDECDVTVVLAEEPEADPDENEEMDNTENEGMENEENEEVLEDPSDTEPDTNSDTTNKFGGFSSIMDIISKIVKIIIDWALKNLPPLITDIVNVVKTSI